MLLHCNALNVVLVMFIRFYLKWNTLHVIDRYQALGIKFSSHYLLRAFSGSWPPHPHPPPPPPPACAVTHSVCSQQGNSPRTAFITTLSSSEKSMRLGRAFQAKTTFQVTPTTSLHLPILIEWTLIFPPNCAVSWFPSLESSCPHFSSHLGSPILSSVLLTELCLCVQIDSGLPCCPQDNLPSTLQGRIQDSAPVSVSPCLAPYAIAWTTQGHLCRRPRCGRKGTLCSSPRTNQRDPKIDTSSYRDINRH